MPFGCKERRQVPQEMENAPPVLPYAPGEFPAPGTVGVEALDMPVVQVVELFF